MFTINTFVAQSSIHGCGVFSGENIIQPGQVIWEFNPRWDLLFSEKEVEELPQHLKSFIKNYGYLDNQQFNGWYVLHIGNDRFTNHSNSPNTIPQKIADCQYVMVACKPILYGDEITCNYNEYEKRKI